MSELNIVLTDKQIEFETQVQKTENVLYGGAKGGGKSHGLREIMLLRRCAIPGSRGVIFRKTYPELYNNHIEPLLAKYPSLKQFYNSQNKEIKFENHSILQFRHCQYERDLSLHQGQEYHDLAIDEVGEWHENWFWTLKGSNRSSRQDIPARFLGTGNPGGIGHKWLKRLFVERIFRPEEDPNKFAFISSKVFDNPALMKADPGYIDRLKANKNPLLVKAYLDGSWDLMAGQFFDNVSRETHMVEPFTIPKHWRRFGAFDTGFNHPAFFGWFAVDEDGITYLYREFGESGLRTEEIVKEVSQYEDKLDAIYAGHDCWNKHSGGPSVAEKFLDYSNLSLTRASVDRIPGAQQVRDYLADRLGGPLVRLFKTCPKTFDALTRMTHDPKRAEDVLKIDAENGDPYTGDDGYDMFRYGLMSRPRASKKLDTEPQDRWARKRRAQTSWKTI